MRELARSLPGKSTVRGRAASEGKADVAPQTGVHRQDGRLPRDALGNPWGQCRIFTIVDRCGSHRSMISAPRSSFGLLPRDGAGGGGSSGAARMQLVAQGEGGMQELPQLMPNWVDIEQSIPCFLASVTLESYEARSASAR